MLISKFDLYKSEWLELVFDDRNKNYGAYELRQHYGRTMVKAMAIAFATIVSAALIIGFLIKPAVTKANDVVKNTVVSLIHYVQPPVVMPPKPLTQHVNSHPVQLPATAPVATQRFVQLVVKPDAQATVEPPKMTSLTSTISNVTSKGSETSPAVIDKTPGESLSKGPGTEIVPFVDLEVMPQPLGGASAWSKFLSKNLRYPEMAVDQHIQGKVWVSFIVEKDGTLSNFKVIRGAGYGLDEEALRVLKLAPAWKPGIQNGQPVRVQYNIPINFQLSDEQ